MQRIMESQWKEAEIRYWVTNIASPVLGLFCLGLLCCTLRLYLLGGLSGTGTIGLLAFDLCIYELSRIASSVSNSVSTHLILELIQWFLYAMSLLTACDQTVYITMTSTVICLCYQINLFNSRGEIAGILGKHFGCWWVVLTLNGYNFFPICLFLMVTLTTVQTKEHKKNILKQLHEQNQQLKAQDQLLESLLQTIPDGVMVMGQDGEVMMCNKELMRILGVEGVGEIGKVIQELRYEKGMKEFNSPSLSLLTDITSFTRSTLPQQTFGTTRLHSQYLEWRGSRSLWQSQPSSILIVRNNTSWIRLSDQLRDESTRKSALIRSVSHELRTPTNAIINLVREAEGREDLPKDCREDLELAAVCSHFLLSMINDLLDFSKVLAGKFSLIRGSFCLAEEIGQTFKLFIPQCRAKGLELRLNIDPTLPERVWTDATRMKQVVLNLMSNAVK